MTITAEDFERMLGDVWNLVGDHAEAIPGRIVMRPHIYWTVRFWAGLTRWRRFVYWLFPDKGERDLWTFLQANGAARRDWREE